jgi:hypothetical protein
MLISDTADCRAKRVQNTERTTGSRHSHVYLLNMCASNNRIKAQETETERAAGTNGQTNNCSCYLKMNEMIKVCGMQTKQC